VETFSPTSKIRFQQLAKETPGSLAQADLKQETYQIIQTRMRIRKDAKSITVRLFKKGIS